MKTRAAILVAIVALLLLGTVALAQSGGPDPPIWYTVEQGSASGGGYRLLGPASPTLRGNGCCCTYLPCVLRNLQ
jgi:hypothetical protein